MKVRGGGQTAFIAGSTEPILGVGYKLLCLAWQPGRQDLPHGHGLGGRDPNLLVLIMPPKSDGLESVIPVTLAL